ncbi:isochorismatase family protein [Bacillaceae bacterium]
MNRTHVWEDVLTDEIRQIASHYADRMGLRKRPALLCIDNYNAVFGDRREPLLEAIKRFPSSCGEAAWDAIEPTRRLMSAARKKGIPLIHTTRDDHQLGLTSTKRQRTGEQDPSWQHAFFPALAPEKNELIIRKTRASAFYGTPLDSYLVQLGVDTLILCGNSTSGCVRATCLEAYMRGYAVAVVEECVFDRNWLSHKVNLFDMNSKYADVMFLDEVLAYLEGV